ncbi:MAG: proline--tRNA ligase anticodon binding domain-containing protein, partial [Bacteroidales bacterium]
PIQVVIVPIYRDKAQLPEISEKALKIKSELEAKGITVKYDDRDTHKPGWKFAEYELKGIPVRLALGPRDIENGTIELARRDTLEKNTYNQEGIAEMVSTLLEEIQTGILEKALIFREENTTEVESWEEFTKVLDNKGGFISAWWDGTTETEEKIKNETKATIRCIPLEELDEKEGKCVFTGNKATRKVLFARAY